MVASPSADAATIQYRLVIDSDMRSLYRIYLRPACTTRSRCVSYLTQLGAAADSLSQDLNRLPAPAALEALSAQAKAAVQQFIEQLNEALSAVQDNTNDYQAATNRPDLHALDLAVAQLDCWPVQPNIHNVEGDYSCA